MEEVQPILAQTAATAAAGEVVAKQGEVPPAEVQAEADRLVNTIEEELQPILERIAATMAYVSNALASDEGDAGEGPADDGEVPAANTDSSVLAPSAVQAETERLVEIIKNSEASILHRIDALLRLPAERLNYVVALAEAELAALQTSIDDTTEATDNAIAAIDDQILRIRSALEKAKETSESISNLIDERGNQLKLSTGEACGKIIAVQNALISTFEQEIGSLEKLLNSVGTRANDEFSSLERKSHELFAGTVRQIQDAGEQVDDAVQSTLGRVKEIAQTLHPLAEVMRAAKAIL